MIAEGSCDIEDTEVEHTKKKFTCHYRNNFHFKIYLKKLILKIVIIFHNIICNYLCEKRKILILKTKKLTNW